MAASTCLHFCLGDGSFTLISIASLMPLVLSAHYAEIFQRKVMNSGVVVMMDGRGGPSYCARAQLISQHVDTGQLNVPPQQ